MVKYLKTFCLIFFISSSIICDPYKQLDIDFLKKTVKKPAKKLKIFHLNLKALYQNI